MWKRSSAGCARLAPRTSTVTGSGWSSLCLQVLSRLRVSNRCPIGSSASRGMRASTVEQHGSSAASDIGLRRVVWSSVLGTSVEWYDFLIYQTAAAFLFNNLFFPSFSPAVGTIAAFGSTAVGFAARPLGGAIFGHFGDRVGRKAMLALTILIMGLGTFLIGCLPTYRQVGIAAPL